MPLPFELPRGRLPVIVSKPKGKPVRQADGSFAYEPHQIRFLTLRSDRGLNDIGFMLDVRQSAQLFAAERYTLQALIRRLSFSDNIEFPGLAETGQLLIVDAKSNKLVWATIPSSVIVTSSFTVLDLRDDGMAVDEPDVIFETIEKAIQGCPYAEPDELLQRFKQFKTPHRTDISRALTALPILGFVREYIDVDQHRRRAVVNMRMIAATRSGILAGMIAADDALRFNGNTVSYGTCISEAAAPAHRKKATKSGRKKKLTRGEYQSRYHSESAARKKEEKRRLKAEQVVADHTKHGYMTGEQLAGLRSILKDSALSPEAREELDRVFKSSHTDPNTEVPFEADEKEKRRHA